MDKLETCLTCDFLQTVRSEEGRDFRLLKLGHQLEEASDLRSIIALESLLRIHEQLHRQFDLPRLIEQISAEAQRVVNAQGICVLLLEGTPPSLHGQCRLHGQTRSVTIPLDDGSPIASAAMRDEVVNLHHPWSRTWSGQRRQAFSAQLDQICGFRASSLLAVPIPATSGLPVGVIAALNRAEGAFSPDDQWFLEKYAVEFALAVEKARLLEDSLMGARSASVGETLAGLSHRIKGIAHTLRSLVYVIREAIEAGHLEDALAACKILDRQGQRVADLSMIVAAYDSEHTHRPVTGDVNETVADVVKVIGQEAEAQAIGLATRLADDLPPCTYDPILLYRCLVHLLTHALNACPAAGGKVFVATARAGPAETMILVSHNGSGESTEVQAQVRALAERAGPTRGIGLPTAAELARRLDARLEIKSKGSQGTNYCVYLPVRGPLPDPAGA
jgi:signal transduction histidine kinase